jgi:hypothetical protein
MDNDLTGRVFTRLTVLERATSRNHSAYWRCKCECGNLYEAQGSQLRNERTKSCGCLKRERIVAQSTTHGHKTREGTSPTYNSWSNMMARCTRPTHPRYKDWGGRGITVCERWLVFENFLADMGEKPPGKTLDRKENSGNYEPGNCRWATPAEQAANTRNLKLTPDVVQRIHELTAQGLTMTAVGRQLGINRHTVAKALF